MRASLILATTNVHKIREFREMLKIFPVLDILTLADYPDYQPPEETGASFEENAILKASHAATTLNSWVLADDSGIVVPSLNGEPGIYSARYAGKDATDVENRKKLLEAMSSLLDDQRLAYHECWLVIASPQGIVKSVNGICEGMIALQERGGSGFGYDPLFIKHDYGKTFAELGETVKNRISHRRKAFEKIVPVLEAYTSEDV